MNTYLKIDKFYSYLKTTFLAKTSIYFKKVNSTNDFAINLIKFQNSLYSSHIEIFNNINSNLNINDRTNINSNVNINSNLNNILSNINNGTLVIAEEQYKSRGRFQKVWFSPPGGLWFTIILNCKIGENNFKIGENFNSIDYNKISKLTLIAASSILAIIRKIIYKERKSNENLNKFYIKWPNDIYFNNYKLSGILSESEKINDIFYIFIGIGINVNNDIKDFKYLNLKNATTLKEIFNNEINREKLLADILNLFERKYLYYYKTNDLNTIFRSIKNSIKYF